MHRSPPGAEAVRTMRSKWPAKASMRSKLAESTAADASRPGNNRRPYGNGRNVPGAQRASCGRTAAGRGVVVVMVVVAVIIVVEIGRASCRERV